ncbi:MAG TPA: hypothetical protein VG651_04315 [Stellaceae bacterium]|nr:hypothetical protein [Stellaceae bacterium]
MSSITIRNPDDRMRRQLRIRAAERNRSIKQDGRDTLHGALAESGG